MAREAGLGDPDLIFFRRWEEVLRGEFPASVLRGRKVAHEAFHRFEFPVRLSHRPALPVGLALGVSAGLAEGLLVRPEEAGRSGADEILLTRLLTPDLAVHFGRVRGILAERGGLLSHLAILARERGVPVVMDPAAFGRLRPGDRVRLDGSAGTVITVL